MNWEAGRVNWEVEGLSLGAVNLEVERYIGKQEG